MKPRNVWNISVCISDPVSVAWEAAFLFCPTHEQIKAAIRYSIAKESQLSQTDQPIETMSTEYEIPKKAITNEMNQHIQNLAWLLHEDPIIFNTYEDVIWEE